MSGSQNPGDDIPEDEDNALVNPGSDGGNTNLQQHDVRTRIVEIRKDISKLLPSGSGRVDWRLNKAAALLNDATQTAEWLTTDLPVADSSAVFHLRDAVKKPLIHN